jgi:CHRD domain-containing protein
MMSRFPLLAVVFALFACGCGSDPAPTTTNTPPTRLVFTAALSAVNEVPALAATNAEIGGRGQATVTMNVTRDAAGAITAGTVDVVATFTGFPNGTILTAAHIHTGNSTNFGGVLIGMVPAAGEVTMPNGSGSYVKSGFPIGPPIDIANQIIANPAGFYFNVHTSTNPGGAARGQLTLVP